jgi:alkaline phosphatase
MVGVTLIPTMDISRRSLLSMGAAGIAAASVPFSAGALSPQNAPDFLKGWKGKRPKNIIFCVSDGMAMQTVTMVDQFQKAVMGHGSYWMDLIEDPRVTSGLQETRSLSSIVTDSAAAASTWGSGRRIWNRMLNMYPNETKLRTLTDICVSQGMKVGLVTTTTMTHATPSGFSVQCINRELEPLIAEMHLNSGVSILLGGGDKFFNASKRKDKKDLYGSFAAKGFRVAKDRDSVLNLNADKILGIFSDSHLPFTVDRDNDPEIQKAVPTLAEMAQVAIRNLKTHRGGFLLQIEGGKVDHAGHSNDLAGHIHDQIAFEAAVKVAIEFAMEDKETLVIITADHATGGPSLNGAGEEYFDSSAALASWKGMKSSYQSIFDQIGKEAKSSSVQEAIEAKLGYQLKVKEAEIIANAINGKSIFSDLELQGGKNSALALVLQNYTKVGWTSLNHTSDHVLVSAFGPGSENVKGLTRNFEFFDLMLAARGMKWSNPTITFEEAKIAFEKLKASIDPEWYAFYAEHEDCDHR